MNFMLDFAGTIVGEHCHPAFIPIKCNKCRSFLKREKALILGYACFVDFNILSLKVYANSECSWCSQPVDKRRLTHQP